jgi:hypothetical protein
MPRDRYTSRVHRSERAHIAQEEKEVIDIAPVMNVDKVRRSLRLARKRKDAHGSIYPT